MARLVVINNQSVPGIAHELGESWVTIGRAGDNHFQIADDTVSSHHCEVKVRGGELWVRDMRSTNGTFVGGLTVSEGVVRFGQTFRLGNVEVLVEASFSSIPKVSVISPGVSMPAPRAVMPLPPKPAASAGEAARKYQVLFVDDSMAFLDSFAPLCGELSGGQWQIHTCTTAALALAVLQERQIDLAVLDINMPMLDGLQLLGIIKRRYPGIKISMLTGHATEGKRADALANGAELFLEKPVAAEDIRGAFNMLNDLVSWHREGFTGSLRHVGLMEVVQMECNGRHSSILEIRNNEMCGQIYIEDGAITHAAVGKIVGEQAFYRLLSLKGGEFQVKPFKSPPQRTIENRWEFLLMDAARAADEENGTLKKTPVHAASPVEVPVNTHTHSPNASDDDMVVVATYDGSWKPEAGNK
jgi:CheY-like chemotaxis protein